MTTGELLAVINGEDLHAYRAEQAIRTRIQIKSKKYEGTPSSKWPPITFNWDLSLEGQRFSLDGVKTEKFEEYYPEGFLLGSVELADFDKILCHYSRRDDGELWEVGSTNKLAQLIVYLSEGRKISPPLVKPLESGEIIFNGGHHRYAIAKELKVKSLPFYVCPESKMTMESLLNIAWQNAN